ncbi:MAG: hypothetical protein M3N91_15955 [Pseudomonadota bacterium]|jgi:hypothetical protein|nr:hypothetical protein [Pseudomonadota bacterium]
MKEPTLKFSVTCPSCASECLAEISIAVIANALLTEKSIRLYSSCHDLYWTATFVEREQLRKTLSTLKVESRHRTPLQLASYSRDPLRKSGCR